MGRCDLGGFWKQHVTNGPNCRNPHNSGRDQTYWERQNKAEKGRVIKIENVCRKILLEVTHKDHNQPNKEKPYATSDKTVLTNTTVLKPATHN